MSPEETALYPKKPIVVLITGWAYGTEAMQPLADALSLGYDVRILTGAEVLSARAIPDADTIITGSMGGLLALELLPESCRKLILISSTARFCASEDYPCGTPERILQRMILQLRRNPTAVLEEFFKNVNHPHQGIPSPAEALPFALEELVKGLEYLRDTDVRDRIPSIGIPVLLLHGADDRIIPAAAAEWLHGHLPDSRLRIFERHGHALLAHHFDEATGEILQFLQS